MNQLANRVVLTGTVKEDFSVQNSAVNRGLEQIPSANRDHFDARSRDGADETRIFRILVHVQKTQAEG